MKLLKTISITTLSILSLAFATTNDTHASSTDFATSELEATTVMKFAVVRPGHSRKETMFEIPASATVQDVRRIVAKHDNLNVDSVEILICGKFLTEYETLFSTHQPFLQAIITAIITEQ